MTIRAKIDRHSLWHPREDMELEAETMTQICEMLSLHIAKEINYSLNSNGKENGLNPLALRINKSDGRPHRVQWQTASSLYDIIVEVEITASKRTVRELSPLQLLPEE